MDPRGWLLAVAAIAFTVAGTACGDVATNPDAPGGTDAPRIDGPSCTGCVANGDGCTADSQCASTHCECGDASCASQVCSAVSCPCTYTTDGAGTCGGFVGLGVDDAADTCGATACDGTGGCGVPLLWYKLDEAAGTGTVANAGTWPGTASVAGTQGAAGKLGSGLQISAPTDGLSIADPIDGSLDGFAGWTVEGWINLSALPLDGYATLAKKDSAYICRLVEGVGCAGCYSVQGIVFVSGQWADNWPMPTPPTTNTWYHLACTYDTNGMYVYWNGTLEVGNSYVGAIADSVQSLGIGKSPGGGEQARGILDDVRMWDVARSPREVCLDACGSYNGTSCAFDAVCGN